MSTRLFDLLPALHRVSDAQAGHALEQLLAVLQEELDRLELDVEGLYDNWFVETCDDWVVPYLGDLVGVRGLGDPHAAALGQRGLVANALARRRRKGTAAVLEQLATDATGWSAKAVEFFSLLGWTQQVNHVRPGAGGTANVRDGERLELTGGPFDPLAHTADVRHIDNGRGRYGIPNVGVFLWRLQAYPIQRGTPFRPATFDGRYWFDPLGRDIRLFNRPRGEEDIDHLAEELNVEGPLRARALRKELRAGVPATAAGDDGTPRYLSAADPVFSVTIDQVRVEPAQLEVCDLEDPSRRAPAGKTVAIDPHRGRLVLAPGATEPGSVEVSYAYGFPGDLGGGPYDRRASVVPEIRGAIDALQPAAVFQRGVTRATGTNLVPTPAAAISDWTGASPRPPVAVIALMDSGTFPGGLTIAVPAGCRLIVAAGDWPADAAG
ncbi:MAG TPA: phage tail protein, partial [Solirubrobacteraceae bacterium]|nr:phage tail protein [Solirubrobacteraceae bacterium]